MDGNLAALLSYLIGIVGIIVLITEKENKFVKFHALQALLFHISFAVIVIVGFFLFFILSFVFALAGAALGNTGAAIGSIISIILWIVGMILMISIPFIAIGGNIYGGIKAYNGNWFKIPIVGNLSMKILGIQN